MVCSFNKLDRERTLNMTVRYGSWQDTAIDLYIGINALRTSRETEGCTVG